MAIKRRDLLKGGAAVAGAFTLGFALPARLHAGRPAYFFQQRAHCFNVAVAQRPGHRRRVIERVLHGHLGAARQQQFDDFGMPSLSSLE